MCCFVKQDQLSSLMKDMKEEGNALFKDKNFYQAGEHYTCGLIIAKHLESTHFVNIDKEMLSTLFSNRAACCLKMVSSVAYPGTQFSGSGCVKCDI